MAKQGTAKRAHKVRRTRGPLPPPIAGFWRADLAAYLGRTTSGIDKLRAMGELPPPIQIGRAPFWTRASIDNWLAGKPAGAK